MNFIDDIERLIPGAPSDEIVWNEADKFFVSTCFSGMRMTRQDPMYHGEGDVYTHTQLVCRELAGDPAFHTLDARRKTELFLAAMLHDIGKVRTTRLEGGNWVSPHHASAGSQIVREFLWRNCGLCGKPELISFRETVCALIRHHMLPVHLMDQEDAERKVREVAAIGELAPDFSWELLCMLAEADVRGRVAEDIDEGLAQVELARLTAEDTGCLYEPYRFADDFTKRAYLSGRKVQPDQVLYDDSWGEVIMLSGLPGTGKDTWLREKYPEFPVVSMDDIRARLRIKPTDSQGKVAQLAQERAREHLRKKRPFIWNATNLTKDTRQKLIGFFEQYGAKVRIKYLETNWNTRIVRNQGRHDAVPEAAVDRMLGKTVLPMPDEAQAVEWLCV